MKHNASIQTRNLQFRPLDINLRPFHKMDVKVLGRTETDSYMFHGSRYLTITSYIGARRQCFRLFAFQLNAVNLFLNRSRKSSSFYSKPIVNPHIRLQLSYLEGDQIVARNAFSSSS
jgi:hypothetical protein